MLNAFKKPYIFPIIMFIGSLLYSIVHSVWVIALSSAVLIIVGILNDKKSLKNIFFAIVGYLLILLVISVIFFRY